MELKLICQEETCRRDAYLGYSRCKKHLAEWAHSLTQSEFNEAKRKGNK